jgi:quinol monooxygenase YgiN
MAHILVRHKVKDYAAWKKEFDSSVEMRRGAGEKSYQVFHPDGDPNHLLVLQEWDSLTNARGMLSSPELRAAMERAGVIEAPEVFFLEEYDRGTL